MLESCMNVSSYRDASFAHKPNTWAKAAKCEIPRPWHHTQDSKPPIAPIYCYGMPYNRAAEN